MTSCHCSEEAGTSVSTLTSPLRSTPFVSSIPPQVPQRARKFPFAHSSKKSKVDVRVTLASAIPDQLFLEQQTHIGWLAIDSAWPADDGRYYLAIQHFQPGLYQLRLADLGSLPLLLTQHRNTLSVHMQGPDFLAESSVENLPAASVYIDAVHLQEQSNYWEFLAVQATKIDQTSARSLAIMDSLAAAARLDLNRFIDSAVRASNDTLLQHFLFLTKRPILPSAEAWWPSALLLDSLIAHSDALRLHTQEYFYAQLNDAFSRPQTDSAFAYALRSLAKLPMHPTVAIRLRAYSRLFFSDARYIESARIAMAEPFGPLPPDPSLAPSPRKLLPASVALRTKVKNLNGKSLPLINKDTRYTLVVIWSVWCPHCQTLLPKIHDWWCELPKGLLDVIAIAIDRPGDALSAHIKLKSWKWRNAVEEDDGDSALLEAIGFEGTPQLILLDAQGNTLTQPQTLTQLQNQF